MMKGRILKIKTGYNPNSSSIGVDMVVFFSAGAGIMVLFNAIAAILTSQKAMKSDPAKKTKEIPVPGQLENRQTGS
jgi:hypothetical protein